MRISFDYDPRFDRQRPGPLESVIWAIRQAQTSGDEPPGWLTPAQVAPYQQATEAVRRFGGTMLAMPVGSGKTYVSLAIASTMIPGGTVAAVVPAILTQQWRETGRRLGIDLTVISHESVSRGNVPDGTGVIIIDESHRFRDPTRRRYRTVAPALVGRLTILATATPIVNQPADLIAQLLLAVPDDALALSGIPSLRALAATDLGSASLDALVVRGDPALIGAPARRAIEVVPPTEPALVRVMDGIGRLLPARDGAIASLIRISFLRALGSSPAALVAALGRYRRLLDHADRAAKAGHPIARRALLQVIGPAPDQLILWELMPQTAELSDLRIGDRRRVAQLRRQVQSWLAEGDAKRRCLQQLLAGDERPTIVFVTALETVRYLRETLGIPRMAWITGSGAGIGMTRVSRESVLAGFRAPRAAEPPAPRTAIGLQPPWLLVATDVAAEGLNLQGIARVVHYDLPWTAVRIEQRDGRAIRLGSPHATVEVVRFGLPDLLEERLAISATLAWKAELPITAGLNAPTPTGSGEPGWVVRRAIRGGAIARFRIGEDGSLVLAREEGGQWTTDRRVRDGVLALAEGSSEPSEAMGIAATVNSLSVAVRGHLDAFGLAGQPANRLAIRAIRARGETLRRCRQRGELEAVGAVHQFLARGHRAGEAAITRALAAGDEAAFSRAATLGQQGPQPVTPTAHLIALVVFVTQRE